MEGPVAKRIKISFDPKAFLSKVNGRRAVSDYRKDQIVYRQGEPSDSVFYIQSGKVKQTVLSEHGKEAVVALLGTGDFFGEGCLTGQPLRLATVSSMTECVIVRITKADTWSSVGTGTARRSLAYRNRNRGLRWQRKS
jgi:CRP/FNR family cyclic AMP-dependent transcriptional regulator